MLKIKREKLKEIRSIFIQDLEDAGSNALKESELIPLTALLNVQLSKIL